MSRLRRADRVLLATLVPLWLVVFALHLKTVATHRLAWIGVFVARPSTTVEPPVVQGLWPGTYAVESGLAAGDRLLQIGTSTLRGIGPVGFAARAYHEADEHLEVPVVYQRDAGEQRALLRLTPLRYPWRIAPFAAMMVVTGLLVLLRVPHAAIGRSFFLGAITYATHWTFFMGGPPVQTYGWAACFLAASLTAFPLCMRAAMVFPPDVSPLWQRWPHWPWIFAAFGPLSFSWLFGTPFSHDVGQRGMLLANVVFIPTFLGVITRSYVLSGPLGRRQLRWALYGLYLGLVPLLLADMVTVTRPEVWGIHEITAVMLTAIPTGFLIGITRYNLFDIDHLIAATATYSMLTFAALAGIVVIVPSLARLVSEQVDVDPRVGQPVLAVLLVGALWPTRHMLRARLEGWLFPEREALRAGVEELLQHIARQSDLRTMLVTTQRRLAALLHASTSVACELEENGQVVLLDASGGMGERDIGAPIGAALARACRVIDLQTQPAGGGRRPPGDARADATLKSLGAEIVLPVLRGEHAVGFLAFGPKRSGDVYFRAELALLGAVAQQMSGELLRLDLGRYAPQEVVNLIVRDPVQLRPVERPVTILFSDIQGSVEIAERLGAPTFRDLQDEYAAAVAQIIQVARGLHVRTIGDAIMALWNAPFRIDAPERAAAEAALEMLAAVRDLNARWHGRDWPELSIRIGVHSGRAMVGNFCAGRRVEFDVRGDAANLASRLEALNKEYGTRILVSGEMEKALGRAFVLRDVDQVRVAGRIMPVTVYELLDRGDPGDERLRRLARESNLAMAAYRERKWDEAGRRFEVIAEEYPDDGLAASYLARVRRFLSVPPPAAWDGVHVAQSK